MYYISDDKGKMKIDAVRELLQQSYWANDRDDEDIKTSIENSVCFGVYLKENNRQIGLARVITDFVTVFYLSDIIVDSDFRGMGIGKALVSAIVNDMRFKDLRGVLVTKDAHGLYRQFGFSETTDWYMGKEPNKKAPFRVL